MSALDLNVTLPVYNEAACLWQNVLRVVRMLDDMDCSFEVVIADNGSSDSTASIARRLVSRDCRIRLEQLSKAGRGGAIKKVWQSSRARIVSYMDIDLSTDLSFFPLLIKPLRDQKADLVVGSRLLPGAGVTRCWRREVISRCYVRLLRAVLGATLSDYQCGFKAADRNAAARVLPLVRNESWFFDTELLFVADRIGLRVSEVPVQWREDRDSRVRLLPTITEDLLGVIRLRWNSFGK